MLPPTTWSAGSGNDILIGNGGADVLRGGAGNDTLVIADAGFLRVAGGTGVDTLAFSGAITLADADFRRIDGIESIRLANAATSLTLGAIAAHAIDALQVTVDGAAVTNAAVTIDGSGLAPALSVNLANDAANVTLRGGSGNDQLVAGSGNDFVEGGAGDDTLNGGAGNDAMSGGAGNDIYFVSSGNDAVSEGANAGIDTVFATVDLRLAANIENLVLQGSALQGYGNGLSNVLTGDAAGNILDGDAGVDAMFGGAGDDVYFVDNGGDLAIENGNEGNDTVFSTAHLRLSANVENLVLQGNADLQGFGNALANAIFGNTGNNLIDGGTGADAMSGGAGNDTYFVDNAGDAVIEGPGQGNDTVFASVNYGLTPEVETLVLQGAADLQGFGNGSANTIFGTSGNNLIDGRAGADVMAGGLGDDTYFVDNIADAVIEGPVRAPTRCSPRSTTDFPTTWRRWCCRAPPTCRASATARPTRSSATAATTSSTGAPAPMSWRVASATIPISSTMPRTRWSRAPERAATRCSPRSVLRSPTTSRPWYCRATGT